MWLCLVDLRLLVSIVFVVRKVDLIDPIAYLNHIRIIEFTHCVALEL